MRILHVISGLHTGGAERTLHSLLAGGLAQRHDNHVVSLSGHGDFWAPIADLGVPVQSGGLSGLRSIPAAMLRLRGVSRDLAPDIVHGWMYHGNLGATVARRAAPGRPPLIWSVRQSLYDIAAEKRGTAMAIRAGRLASRSADRIVYNSETARRQHEAFGFVPRSVVIPNGFDTARWKPDPAARADVRRELGLGPTDLLVGFVGRNHPVKDLPTLLGALERAMAGDPRLHCALAGLALVPDDPSLAPFLDRLPPGRAHALGPRTDIPRLMAGFDLLCLSSRGEAFPNVIGEAMATGVPCIATDVGDCGLLMGGMGTLVPSSDPAALAGAIRAALSLPEAERYAAGRRARARIEMHFNLTSALGTYISLYEDVGRDG